MSGDGIQKLNLGWVHGDVELKKDSGIQKSAFGNDEISKSIFNKYDTDKNGILDSGEMQKLYDDLVQKAGGEGERMSRSEAKEFLKECGIDAGRFKARGIIEKFLSVIGGAQDNVKSATRNNNTVDIEYNNGMTEQYRQYDGTNTSVLAERKFTNENGEHILVYHRDGKTISQETITKNNVTTTTEYDQNGNKTSVTVEDGKSKITTKFDTNGNVTGKTKVEGNKTTELDANDKPLKEIEGNKTTEFAYNKDGKITQKTITENGATTVQEFADNGVTLKKETITNEDGDVTVKEYSDDGKTVKSEKTTKNDGTVIETKEDGTTVETTVLTDKRTIETITKNGSVETIIREQGESLVLELEDGMPFSHAKYGESNQKIANRLGVPLDKLMAANPKAEKRGYFLVGEKVFIPKDFLGTMNLDGYDVDSKAEIQSFKEWKAAQRIQNSHEEEEVSSETTDIINSMKITYNKSISASQNQKIQEAIDPTVEKSSKIIAAIADMDNKPGIAERDVVSVNHREGGHSKTITLPGGKRLSMIKWKDGTIEITSGDNDSSISYIYHDGNKNNNYSIIRLPNNQKSTIPQYMPTNMTVLSIVESIFEEN